MGRPIQPRRIVIAGFGGHARSATDVALRLGYQQVLYIDENSFPDESFLGFKVLQNWEQVDESWTVAFPGSGDAVLREEQCEAIKKAGLQIASLVSPLACIGVGSSIQEGTFVGHYAIVGPGAKVGKACILNTGSIVEHEVRVGDLSHVSIQASIAGRTKIGKHVLIGAGATVIDKITITDNVIVAAGAVVVQSIDRPGTYLGVPARLIQ